MIFLMESKKGHTFLCFLKKCIAESYMLKTLYRFSSANYLITPDIDMVRQNMDVRKNGIMSVILISRIHNFCRDQHVPRIPCNTGLIMIQ